MEEYLVPETKIEEILHDCQEMITITSKGFTSCKIDNVNIESDSVYSCKM